MKNGKYFQWDDKGNAVPVDSMPYTKQTSQSLLAAALATPYEGEDSRYWGLTKGEVIALREAELAADGDMEAIKDINDRMMGKPKQQTETITITATLGDFLNEVATRNKLGIEIPELPVLTVTVEHDDPNEQIIDVTPQKQKQNAYNKLGDL